MTMTRKNWYKVVPLFLTNYTNLLTYPNPLESFTPQCSKIQKKECNFWEFVFGQSGMCATFILFVTSIHQTTNSVFPNFFHEFFSVWPDEKENKLFIGPKLKKKICYGPVNFVSFSTAEAEKLSWKKLGKIRFVVWWFHVTNKIFIRSDIYCTFSNCRALCSAPKYYFFYL